MMKLALVCPTVGQTRRGYERFMTDLFRLLRTTADVRLFKGGGEPRPDEIVVPHVSRTGRLERLLGPRLRYPRYHLEFASFAGALIPHLVRWKPDVVHIIDPPLGRLLHAARRWNGGGFRLVFTDAGPAAYDASRWADHMHYLTPSAIEGAKRNGIAEERMTMLPVGIAPLALAGSSGRDELRRRHSVSLDTFVILSVATLNRHHKRVDHLIEEAARLDGDFLLWIDGGTYPDGDPTLLDQARARLGDRFRHTHLPSDRLGDLYGLADVMVSASLRESFGMAVVEAAASGLPVVTHDSPHFRWLLGNAGHYVDMRSPGMLSGWLRRRMTDPGGRAHRKEPDSVVGRFGWDHLKAGYLEMYGNVMGGRKRDVICGLA